MVTSHSTGPVLEGPEQVSGGEEEVRPAQPADLPHLPPVRQAGRLQPGPRQYNLHLAQSSPAIGQLQGSP